MKWINQASEEQKNSDDILSFEEYMQVLGDKPELEIRNTALYIKDVFDHFGRNEKGGYKLFNEHFQDSPPVFGQGGAQKEIYQNIENFLEEGLNNKFILLVGPNGSSKSSLVKKIMAASEEYSKDDRGRLHTFSWVFPIEGHIKGALGLTTHIRSGALESYAHLEDKEISAIISSELRDHPLLLLPLKARQNLINEKLAKFPKRLATIRKSYLYNGDISKKNRLIYDALLKNYKGDYKEMLKHIRVERFIVSRRYSTSAATIEPQLHVDAKIHQLTMDRRLSSLPPSLQSLSLFQLHGEVVMANRGILEFSDLLKRPLDTYKYLLMTMETKNINLEGILTELDIFFIGSSNEIHLTAFKQHPDFNSFKGRMNFVRVPYLLNYRDEEKIYEDQVISLRDKSHFEPHSLKVLSLFAVMTRFRPSIPKNYNEDELGRLTAALSPLEKALFLGDMSLPERLTSEEKQILHANYEDIYTEFESDPIYEGKFGISPREMKHIIYELSMRNPILSFVEVIEYLAKFIERKNEHEFLNIAPQGDFNNPYKFLQLLKDYSLDLFDTELRNSLGMVDDRSYEDYIIRYIMNINASMKSEKIKNNVTGKFEDADQYFIKEFEHNIQIKEKPEIFRGHLLSTLGAFSLDNPGKKIMYTEVFPELVKMLKESFRTEQKKSIQNISKNLVFFISEYEQEKKQLGKTPSPLNEEGRTQIRQVIQNLHKNNGYSEEGALNLLRLLVKERF